MTDRELMQMALDALANFDLDVRLKVMPALRARLAQPEPEPVAWWNDMGHVVDLNVSGHGTPLYTAPPQRKWQGLTDEEITETLKRFGLGERAALARAIEAKLKEKNS